MMGEDDGQDSSGQMPRLVHGRSGTRLFSLAAVVERVLEQFRLEHGGGSPALSEAVTSAQRYRLILDCVEYVLAVESIALADEDRAGIVRQAYSDLFGYGPLDALFADLSVTTIMIQGPRRASVRRGHGELEALSPLFEDGAQLTRIITRLLEDAGAQPGPNDGVLEIGLTVGGRPASVTVALPPVAMTPSLDVRLHGPQPLSLQALVQAEMLTADAAELIRQIAQSRYGFAIVGEGETGKTTLLNALLPLLPEIERAALVERTGELRPPRSPVRLCPVWSAEPLLARSFGDQIEAALAHEPSLVVLDEVRADQPRSIGALLEAASPPRAVWSVRGVPDAKRLQSALGMLARRAGMTTDEGRVLALYERLPFVITLARIRGRLQVFSIAEWQSRIDTDYPDYVMLYQYREGAAQRTEAQLARWLEG